MYKANKINILVIIFVCVFFVSNAYSDIKTDIYSKLKCCSCQISFDKCACAEAIGMKAYIDALLENGMSKEDIFYRVAKKFSLNTILDEQIKATVEKRLLGEAGEKRPQINLDSASFDFGKVYRKQGNIGKTFKLGNKGNSPLIIRNIKTSCPCATVSLSVNKIRSPYFGTEGYPKDWKAEILPGQEGELELLIDLASPHVKVGKLIRDAIMISNDPLYPEIAVRVEAEVIE